MSNYLGIATQDRVRVILTEDGQWQVQTQAGLARFTGPEVCLHPLEEVEGVRQGFVRMRKGTSVLVRRLTDGTWNVAPEDDSWEADFPHEELVLRVANPQPILSNMGRA